MTLAREEIAKATWDAFPATEKARYWAQDLLNNTSLTSQALRSYANALYHLANQMKKLEKEA